MFGRFDSLGLLVYFVVLIMVLLFMVCDILVGLLLVVVLFMVCFVYDSLGWFASIVKLGLIVWNARYFR